jgi:hypothetical protein
MRPECPDLEPVQFGAFLVHGYTDYHDGGITDIRHSPATSDGNSGVMVLSRQQRDVFQLDPRYRVEARFFPDQTVVNYDVQRLKIRRSSLALTLRALPAGPSRLFLTAKSCHGKLHPKRCKTVSKSPKIIQFAATKRQDLTRSFLLSRIKPGTRTVLQALRMKFLPQSNRGA